MAHLEPFAGEQLRAAFEAEGIDVVLGAKAARAERDGDDGPVTLTLDDGRTFTGDEILVAVGRRPNTADLGLDTVGLEPGEAVEVDDQLRATGVDGGWLYAIGDVNGRTLLTHMGKYQARIAADAILQGSTVEAWADHRAVPSGRVHRSAARVGRPHRGEGARAGRRREGRELRHRRRRRRVGARQGDRRHLPARRRRRADA